MRGGWEGGVGNARGDGTAHTKARARTTTLSTPPHRYITNHPPHLQVAVDHVHRVAVLDDGDDRADERRGVALGVVAALDDAVKELAAAV